jgi:selenide, water dikinase
MGATAQVLRQLPKPTDPNLLVGTDHFDDAGVYKLDETTALVLTLDFFPPLVDDPYQFGRIAAANSLSDVYAMGGRPISALNIVGFPDDELPLEILGEILRGGAERVTAAKAVTAGGHSVRDAEIKYGLSVTGVVHPDQIWTNDGAKVGDVLVLTKPIGSGILTSAAKLGKIPIDELQQAVDVMTDLNAAACEAAQKIGVRGVTDITGFGLVGHASEMANGSNLSIEIEATAVPLLEQTAALAKKKMLTRAYISNLEALGDRFEARGVDQLLVNILADAQTSGGLLIAVAEDKVDALVAALKERSTPAAAIVGRCVPRTQQSVTLA